MSMRGFVMKIGMSLSGFLLFVFLFLMCDSCLQSLFALSDESQGVNKGRYEHCPKYNCPYTFCPSRFYTQQELNRHIRNYHHDEED